MTKIHDEEEWILASEQFATTNEINMFQNYRNIC